MFKPIILCSIAVLLAACSADKNDVRRQAYLDADYYTRLELPPDLTEPSYSKELLIPEPGEDARRRFEEQTAGIGSAEESGDEDDDDEESSPATAPPPKPALVLAGAALIVDGDRRWLQLEQPLDRIWSVLETFLVNEGVPVARREPLIGMMETDWVSKYQAPPKQSFIKRAFNYLEPDRIDRFTVRIEQGDPENVSRVFVTHAGMERFVDGDDVNWRSREREPALEAEMLQRLALFVGAGRSRLEGSEYRPFAERMRGSDYHANSLEVVGAREHVQARVETALREIGINRIETLEDGTLQIMLDAESAQVTTVEDDEEDELAESSFIMQWLTGGDSEDATRLTLRFTELEHYTRLDIEDMDGDLDDSVFADQLSDRLQELLI